MSSGRGGVDGGVNGGFRNCCVLLRQQDDQRKSQKAKGNSPREQKGSRDVAAKNRTDSLRASSVEGQTDEKRKAFGRQGGDVTDRLS